MADENGYTLYEFSDPPILGNSVIGPGRVHYGATMGTSGKAHPNLPYAVHGFSRRISTKSKGSWWGYDVHAPHSYPQGKDAHARAENGIPETCTKGGSCTYEERRNRLCTHCTEEDGKVIRDSGSGSFKCKCVKDWENVKKIGMPKFHHEDAKIWTGYTYWRSTGAGWHWSDGADTPQWIMDITYYRLGDHTFSEEEMKAIYEKGRSTSVE